MVELSITLQYSNISLMLKQRLIEYAIKKNHAIQTITDLQLKQELMSFFPADFFFKTNQLTIKKMAALVLMDMSEPVCECCGKSVSDRFPWKPNQTTADRITPYGSWPRTCSASCNQKMIEISGKRKQTFIDRFGHDNPMKDNSIAKKSIKNRHTNWEQVGIDQQKRKLLQRGVSQEFIDSIDFRSDISKANAVILKAQELEVQLGRKPFRREIAEYIGMHYVMVHRWLRTPDTQHLYIDSSVSQQQMEVFEYVKSLGVECILSDRTTIAPHEIDIFIPSLKIGIEYNGIWNHSEGFGKDSKYHLNKTELCQQKGILLLQIYDVEWMDATKQKIWKSIIKTKIGIVPRKIYARKTIIREISSKSAMNFLEENHLNGYVKTSHHVGLFYNNELVSVLSYGKSRFDDSTEIIRMASLRDTVVVGGVSKLFSYVKSCAKHITCFSDRRYASLNSAYCHVLSFVGYTEPNWYGFNCKDYELKSRHQFMRHKVKELLGNDFDDSKTTFENMLDNGYDRIWDSGNLKFEWKETNQ